MTRPASAPAVAISDYPYFDWLRFAMASVVVLVHAGMESPISGNLAVQVFFALSGWLIGSILLSIESKGLPRFFYNRVTRIWIPYLCAVILLYAVSTLKDPVNARWLEFLFYDLTFTHNWFSLLPVDMVALAEMPLKGTGNHFWSISVEEQFYLVAPILILFTKFGRHPILWFGLSAALLAMGFPGFASISLGVTSAAYNVQKPQWHLEGSSVAALGVIAVVAYCATRYPSLYDVSAPWFAVSTVLLLARPGQRTEAGKFFGGISYPVYLYHWTGVFLINAIAKVLPIFPATVKHLIAYAIGVAFGAGTYMLIDRPVLENRGKYFTVTLGRNMGLTAYALLLLGLTVGILKWKVFT